MIKLERVDSLEQEIDQDEITFDDEEDEQFSEIAHVREVRDHVCNPASRLPHINHLFNDVNRLQFWILHFKLFNLSVILLCKLQNKRIRW
jgi:hypothetical protein